MPINVDNKNSIFKLSTQNTDYIIKVINNKYLIHLYYGGKISDTNVSYLYQNIIRSFCPYKKEDGLAFLSGVAPMEYSFFGSGDYRTDSLRVQNIFGDCNTLFVYKDYKIFNSPIDMQGLPSSRKNENQTLEIHLKSDKDNTDLYLLYTTFEETNVIAKSVKIVNNNASAIIVKKCMSSCLQLKGSNYLVTSLGGAYANERACQQRKIAQGMVTLESRRGTSSHQNNPFFAVSSSNATEENGCVYGFNLVYSGNFKAEIEVDEFLDTRIVYGINNECCEFLLQSGENFMSPECIITFSNNGFGGMSRNFHNHIRGFIIDKKYLNLPRPVVLNTWEVAYFNIDENKLLSLASDCKDLGIDTLVLDDGWFANRNNDKSSLGDWYASEKKFKSGLAETVKKINAQGLNFGLWIEPEMINEDSDLFKEHSDWTLGKAEENFSLSRNQYVIDMANDEVIEYLFNSLYKILSQNNVSYVKWDMNRSLSEVYGMSVKKEKQLAVSHLFLLGVYKLYSKLQLAFPNVFFESCSGGGGRFDLGMLYFTPQIWTSDNINPYERNIIQLNTSLGYPVSSMSCHVGRDASWQKKSDLNFKFYNAIFGTLGYELDINKLSTSSKNKIKKQIQEYKKIEKLIKLGDLYRLTNVFEVENKTAILIMSKDKKQGFFIFYQLSYPTNPPLYNIKFVGLLSNTKYKINNSETLFGDTLMQAGLQIPHLHGDGKAYFAMLNAIE